MCGRHEGLQVVGVTLRGVVRIVRALEQRFGVHAKIFVLQLLRVLKRTPIALFRA